MIDLNFPAYDYSDYKQAEVVSFAPILFSAGLLVIGMVAISIYLIIGTALVIKKLLFWWLEKFDILTSSEPSPSHYQQTKDLMIAIAFK